MRVEGLPVRRMRIGVNALYLIPGGVGGTEIYLRQLLGALGRIDSEAEYFVFSNRESGPDLVPALPTFHLCPQPVSGRNRPARILYEQLSLSRVIARKGIDVLLNPGFTAPLLHSVPMVTVFHDLQHVKHPEHFKFIDLPFWRLLLAQSARRSARIIAVSEATRGDVLAHYRLQPGKVVTVPHGVEHEFFELKRDINRREPFLLCVSTLHPHKNIERLLQAFAGLRIRHPALRLVLAGIKGFHTQRVEQVVAELRLQKFVTITGWIPREELYRLYASATAFVYPSTFEGFGMPLLEAMASRVPIACSDIPPLRSVAGTAALFFDPLNQNELREALEVLLTGPELVASRLEQGRARARENTWERAAEATLGILKSVVPALTVP